jgi:large subunit ribosomal protein L24
MYEAPLHLREAAFTARLERELVNQYHVKRLPIRVNDHVRVVSGQFRDLEGKVLGVYRNKYKITVDEITKEKADGSLHYYPIHPSKVIITKLVDVDKWRQKIIDRRAVTDEERQEKRVEGKSIGKKGRK